MAWAGSCRNIREVGPCLARITMANAAIPPTEDRMSVLLGFHEIRAAPIACPPKHGMFESTARPR